MGDCCKLVWYLTGVDAFLLFDRVHALRRRVRHLLGCMLAAYHLCCLLADMFGCARLLCRCSLWQVGQGQNELRSLPSEAAQRYNGDLFSRSIQTGLAESGRGLPAFIERVWRLEQVTRCHHCILLREAGVVHLHLLVGRGVVLQRDRGNTFYIVHRRLCFVHFGTVQSPLIKRRC